MISYSSQDVEYVKQALNAYYTSHPKMDELKFVKDLAEHCNVTSDNIIKPIKEIRKEQKKGFRKYDF